MICSISRACMVTTRLRIIHKSLRRNSIAIPYLSNHRNSNINTSSNINDSNTRTTILTRPMPAVVVVPGLDFQVLCLHSRVMIIAGLDDSSSSWESRLEWKTATDDAPPAAASLNERW